MLEEAVSLENWVQSDRPEAGDEKLLVRFYHRPVQNKLKTEGGEIPVLGPLDPRLRKLQAEAESSGYKVEVDLSDPKSKKAVVTGAGRPIFDAVEFVEIRIPDKVDKFNLVDRPAKKRDRLRFRRQYEAFKAATAEEFSGTPLSKWPLVSSTQVEELKYLKIDGEPHPVRTVEQLADFPEEFLPYLGALGAFKKKAADYIAHAKGQAPHLQVRAENDQLRSQMAALQQQVQMLIQGAHVPHVPTGPVEIVPANAPIPDAVAKKGPGRPRKQVVE